MPFPRKHEQQTNSWVKAFRYSYRVACSKSHTIQPPATLWRAAGKQRQRQRQDKRHNRPATWKKRETHILLNPPKTDTPTPTKVKTHEDPGNTHTKKKHQCVHACRSCVPPRLPRWPFPSLFVSTAISKPVGSTHDLQTLPKVAPIRPRMNRLLPNASAIPG